MCSIIASSSKSFLEELVDLNQFRGNFSFSYLELDSEYDVLKQFGRYNKDVIVNNQNYKTLAIKH